MCNIIIGENVKRFFLLNIGIAVLAASVAHSSAQAQSRQYGYPDGPTLVAPDGAILDYVPEGGDIIVSRDGMGRRVYLDGYGNIVATEMRQDRQRPRYQDRGRPRYEEYPSAPDEYRDYRRAEQYPPRYEDQAGYGYRDYRQYRPGDAYEPGAVTGSVGTPSSVTRMPLEEQQLPGVDQGYPEEASLEPNAGLPPAESLHPDKPVITVTKKPQAEIAALQVFLDREGISPGVIDGHLGDNVNKAIAAWQEMTGETLDPNNSEDIMQRLTYSGGLPIVDYTITPADAAGPYVASIPDDYAHKATMPAMSYTSVTEKLAEQFHMDENYLKSLNPNADFSIPGTIIKVINPAQAKTGQVTRIVADKGRKQVFAYGADGNLISAYPATIGSSDTPSPTGNHTVQRIALDPGYTYNPKINFTQGNNTQILQIPPGPNGPVGTVWIALSKPTYGIHGTPEPSKIGKTNSHGCIRLTNWDATELAKMVKPGTTVEFVE
jgi:lipoprotein-anchoring transpeptidase ErfK/SrfK